MKTLNEILKNVSEGQKIAWSYLDKVKELKLYHAGNKFTGEGAYFETYTTGKLNSEEEHYALKEEKNRVLIEVVYPTFLTSGYIMIERVS